MMALLLRVHDRNTPALCTVNRGLLQDRTAGTEKEESRIDTDS